MHNNDFDIPLEVSTNLPNYKSAKPLKILKKQVLSVQHEFGVRIFIYALFSPKLKTLFGYLSPEFTLLDEHISNGVHNVITCVENMLTDIMYI